MASQNRGPMDKGSSQLDDVTSGRSRFLYGACHSSAPCFLKRYLSRAGLWIKHLFVNSGFKKHDFYGYILLSQDSVGL